MEQTPDATYIERIRNGDPSAYRPLVDRYRAMAYTLAFSILRQETEAEDAAQEGFIKAYQNLEKFRGEAQFSTWLYTIVYRTALKSRRRASRSRAGTRNLDWHEVLPASNAVRDSTPTQHEVLTQQERRRYLKRAIASLPDTTAAIVTLYYLDEKSIEEVAKITALTRGNVKVKLHRARKKLHRILSPIIQEI